MICDHPEHNASETCEERAVGCDRYCECCLGAEGVAWNIAADAVGESQNKKALIRVGTVKAKVKICQFLGGFSGQ